MTKHEENMNGVESINKSRCNTFDNYQKPQGQKINLLKSGNGALMRKNGTRSLKLIYKAQLQHPAPCS
jgi:hypothetical protein